MKLKFVIASTANFFNVLRQYKKDNGLFTHMDKKYKNMYLIGSFITFFAVISSYLSNK